MLRGCCSLLQGRSPDLPRCFPLCGRNFVALLLSCSLLDAPGVFSHIFWIEISPTSSSTLKTCALPQNTSCADTSIGRVSHTRRHPSLRNEDLLFFLRNGQQIREFWSFKRTPKKNEEQTWEFCGGRKNKRKNREQRTTVTQLSRGARSFH